VTPARTASSIAQRISQLCKADKLPEPWDPAQFVGLINSYAKLIQTVNEDRPDPDQADQQDLDDIFLFGRRGAYSAMEKKARAADAAARRSRKSDKKL